MHSHNRHLMDENIVLHERNHHVDRKIAQKKKIKSISTENRKLYIRFQRFLLIIRTILFFFSFVRSLYAEMHTTTIVLTDTVQYTMTRLCIRLMQLMAITIAFVIVQNYDEHTPCGVCVSEPRVHSETWNIEFLCLFFFSLFLSITDGVGVMICLKQHKYA